MSSTVFDLLCQRVYGFARRAILAGKTPVLFGSKMRNAKCEMRNAKCQVPSAKCQVPQVPSAKCQVPSAKCQTPNTKCQMPNATCQMPNAKCQMPNAKCQVPSAKLKYNNGSIRTRTVRSSQSPVGNQICLQFLAARSQKRARLTNVRCTLVPCPHPEAWPGQRNDRAPIDVPLQQSTSAHQQKTTREGHV